ncbi:MAG: DUF2027 domain-containing protein [Prolixibacteraceae bacterium]
MKIGDIVRFMNEVGGGKVTAILSKDMVSVETEDGFEIPTYVKNLIVVDTPDAPRGRQTQGTGLRGQETIRSQRTADDYKEVKSEGFKEVNQKKGGEAPDFIFAALPENPGNPPEGKILLHLVNDCNFTLIYHFATKMNDQYTTVDAGLLEPNTKVELEQIKPRGIGDLPEYCFQLLYFRKSATVLEEPVQKEIRISPVKFYNPSSFVKNNYFSTPALLIRLVDHPLKAELEKLTDKDFQQVTLTKEPKKPVKAQPTTSDLVEVDLHVHQLIDDVRGLANADMLKLQMDTFRKELDNAIATGVKRIVFIHGVGDGVLKNELRRELGRKYSKFPYQDASFREYGFGATMVILRK